METKNCHIVQQAYLKFFASNPQKTKIWQFNKKDNPIEKSIKKVSQQLIFFIPEIVKDGVRRLLDSLKEGKTNKNNP